MTVGIATPRVEAPLKVTGAAKYAADIYPPNTLYGVLVGSPLAAGKLLAVEADEARALPGVVRILFAQDLPHIGKLEAPAAVTRMPMQDDVIEWEGQPVAIVLAESIEAAEQAASRIRVRIEPHAPDTPGRGRLERPPETFYKPQESKGSISEGLAAADTIIRESYFQPTRNHNPMETSAAVAAWDGDRLTLWDATQMTLNPLQVMAAAFGIPVENVRIISPHTGGGFGCKGFVWPHEILAAAAARVTGRPVRLQLSRAQQYSMVGHQAECRQTVTLGATRDGKLTAVRHEAINTCAISDTQFEAPAAASRSYYASPNIETDQQIERIHLICSTPMRAPIEGPGSWALESAMDELARALEMDPLDLRLANFAEAAPFDGKPWSSNKLREAYAEASEVYGWRSRHERPRQDGIWRIGHGMSTASTFCARMVGKARVRVRADGVTVEASANDIGTGNQTVFALVAAETLGISPDRVTIQWGDSEFPPAGPVYGSSQTMGMGSAVQHAAQDARRKLQLYGATEEGPLDLPELLRRANVAEIEGDGSFELPGGRSFNGSGTPYAMQSWGANFVEVGVDPDLGLVRLRRVVARYSAGRIINPLTARSQMIGSIIWEWGKATMEASIVEPTHGRFLAKNLSNVAIPVNADIPADIDVGFIDEYDEYASPIGARGIGELGATGVAAAIANAIYDAVGARVREVPILPAHILAGLSAA